MSDDPHSELQRLAAFADAEPEGEDLFDDPRWEELAAGTASPETREELERLADEAGMPEAMELFAPLSEEAQARVEAAVEKVVGERASASGKLMAPTPIASRRPVVLGLVAALAVAALLALWLRPSSEPVASRWPSYVMTVEGGERAMRSEEAVRLYRPGSPVVVLLRPEQRTEGAPEVRAWVRGRDRVIAMPGRVQTAATGTLRFTAELPEELPAEPVRLFVVVGDADALPPADADAATLDRLASSLQALEAPLPLAPSGETE